LAALHTPPTSQASPLSLHDALPILPWQGSRRARAHGHRRDGPALHQGARRAELLVYGGVAFWRTGGSGDPLSAGGQRVQGLVPRDRKSTRLNSSHQIISYAVFCLKK